MFHVEHCLRFDSSIRRRVRPPGRGCVPRGTFTPRYRTTTRNWASPGRSQDSWGRLFVWPSSPWASVPRGTLALVKVSRSTHFSGGTSGNFRRQPLLTDGRR